MGDEVEVKLGADVAGVKSGMQDALNAVTSSTKGITDQLNNFSTASKKTADDVHSHHKELGGSFAGLHEQVKFHFEAMGGVVETFRSNMLALGAVVAGGALFKESIDAVIHLTDEVEKLSLAFGMSAEESTQMSIALKLIGKDGAEYTNMAMKLQRMIKSNGDAVNQMGLEFKDAEGNLKPLNELTQDAIKVLGDYKEGTDRNAAALYLFGRNASEVYGYFKLNEAVMQRAKDIMHEYNIEVDVEAVRKFKEEQAALGIAFEAVEHKLGEALMPVLTRLAAWLNDVGPSAIHVFDATLKTISSSIQAFAGAWEEVMVAVSGAWQVVNTFFTYWSAGLTALLKGDFDQLPQIIRNGTDQIKNDFIATGNLMVDVAKGTSDKIAAIWHPEHSEQIEGGPGKGSKTFTEPKKKESPMAGWEAELAQAKDAFAQMSLDQGNFQRYSQEQEAAFWQSKIALTEEGSKERQEVTKKYYELEYKIKEEAFAAEIAQLEASKNAFKGNIQAKIDIAQKEYGMIAKAYGDQSKQAEQAYGKILTLRRELADQNKKIVEIESKQAEANALHEISMQQTAMAQAVAMREASKAQQLSSEQDYENQRYDIAKKSLDDRLTLAQNDPDRNPETLAQLHAQLETLEQGHQDKLTNIRNQAIQESSKYQLQAQQAMQSSFEGLINAFETGNKSFKDMLKDWANSIVSALNKIAAQKLAEQSLGGGSSGGSALSGIAGALFGGGSSGSPAMAMYDVGTPYVPQDQIAMIHKGEAIIPANQNNPASMGGVNIVVNMQGGNGQMDARTQQQLASAVGVQMQRAMSRNT